MVDWTKDNVYSLAEKVADSSLRAVGDDIGLSGERVRQIITEHVDPLMIQWLRLKAKIEREPVKMNFRDRFWRRAKRRKSGCIEWVGYCLDSGYGRLSVGGEAQLAHRVSWVLTHGEIPKMDNGKTMHVCHHCDNPCCVNPDHLFLGTPADNMHDRDAKGRHGMAGNKEPRPNARGPRRQTRKYSYSLIRNMRRGGMTIPAICEETGASDSTVCRAIYGDKRFKYKQPTVHLTNRRNTM